MSFRIFVYQCPFAPVICDKSVDWRVQEVPPIRLPYSTKIGSPSPCRLPNITGPTLDSVNCNVCNRSPHPGLIPERFHPWPTIFSGTVHQSTFLRLNRSRRSDHAPRFAQRFTLVIRLNPHLGIVSIDASFHSCRFQSLILLQPSPSKSVSSYYGWQFSRQQGWRAKSRQSHRHDARAAPIN